MGCTRTTEEDMCEFTEMVAQKEKSGEWKSYPDGSIYDSFGNEILPRNEIPTEHHRFTAMPPKSIEHLADAGYGALT